MDVGDEVPATDVEDYLASFAVLWATSSVAVTAWERYIQ
jgi:hypothetical protein